MIKAEPKYCMQVCDYIELLENLPKDVPKFDIDMLIRVEILESGIEITDKDLDENIPKKLRATKLTGRERYYF